MELNELRRCVGDLEKCACRHPPDLSCPPASSCRSLRCSSFRRDIPAPPSCIRPFFRRVNAHTRATVRRKARRTSVDPPTADRMIPPRNSAPVYELLMPGSSRCQLLAGDVSTRLLDKEKDVERCGYEEIGMSEHRRREGRRERKSLVRRDVTAEERRARARACEHNFVLRESDRNSHRMGTGRGRARGKASAVPWISVYSGERNVHRRDRNSLEPPLHSCPARLTRLSRYGATTRNATTRNAKTIPRVAVRQSNEKRDLDSTIASSSCHRAGCLPSPGRPRLAEKPKNPSRLRTASELVGHYYSRHVGGIYQPRQRATRISTKRDVPPTQTRRINYLGERRKVYVVAL